LSRKTKETDVLQDVDLRDSSQLEQTLDIPSFDDSAGKEKVDN